MNPNRMVPTKLGLFPSLQTSFTTVGTSISQTRRLKEVSIEDGTSTIKPKGTRQSSSYYSSDWDEAYLSLDVYLSLVDHGDFD